MVDQLKFAIKSIMAAIALIIVVAFLGLFISVFRFGFDLGTEIEFIKALRLTIGVTEIDIINTQNERYQRNITKYSQKIEYNKLLIEHNKKLLEMKND